MKRLLKGVLIGVILYYAIVGIGYTHYLKERYWVVIDSTFMYVREQGRLIEAYENACPALVPGEPRTDNTLRGA